MSRRREEKRKRCSLFFILQFTLQHVSNFYLSLDDSKLINSRIHRSAGKQPGTQIKLTNVSVVRLKKQGKRFEVRFPYYPSYPNMTHEVYMSTRSHVTRTLYEPGGVVHKLIYPKSFKSTTYSQTYQKVQYPLPETSRKRSERQTGKRS